MICQMASQNLENRSLGIGQFMNGGFVSLHCIGCLLQQSGPEVLEAEEPCILMIRGAARGRSAATKLLDQIEELGLMS